MDPPRQLSLLLEFSDMLRISLAGNLKDYEVMNTAGELVRGDKVFYGAYPAAYAASLIETVNYAACHDNETLFDQARLLHAPHPPSCKHDAPAATIPIACRKTPLEPAGHCVTRCYWASTDSQAFLGFRV